MASSTQLREERFRLPVVQPRQMTRCECAGVSFSRVKQLMDAQGLSVEEACRRTGCGQTCGGCIPDLLRFLAGR